MQYIKNIALLAVTGCLIAGCARPIADFSFAHKDATAPAEVRFNNHSKKAEQYEWDFGDGKKSDQAAPTHRYQSSGQYTITLNATKGNKTSKKSKKLTIAAPKKCYVEIETDYGNMTILLYDATPQHRDNFIKLAEDGFFNGLLFHRVMNGFMIQGGDPDSKNAQPGQRLGMGGPGYQVPAEFADTLIHLKGALAAARIGGPTNPEKKSSGSQFYIVQGKKMKARELDILEAQKNIRYSEAQRKQYIEQGGTPQLDREYTVFGQVISGLEVIDKIAAVMTDANNRPKKDVKMQVKVIQ